MPDTAALEHRANIRLLHMQLVAPEGLGVGWPPVGQWLKGFAYAHPKSELHGLPPHRGHRPNEQLTHAEGAQTPAKDCGYKIKLAADLIGIRVRLTINARLIGVVFVLQWLIQDQHVDQYGEH